MAQAASSSPGVSSPGGPPGSGAASSVPPRATPGRSSISRKSTSTPGRFRWASYHRSRLSSCCATRATAGSRSTPFNEIRGGGTLGRDRAGSREEHLEQVIRRQRERLRWIAELQEQDQIPIVRYEDLVLDLPGTAERLGSWLGVSSMPRVLPATSPSAPST